MSIIKSPSPSLTEAKKQRKQLENDSLILSNRIKLLQAEEQKAWKKIEEIKKRQKSIEEFRKKSEESAKLRFSIVQKKQKEREENSQKILEFKEKSERSKNKKLEIIFENKKRSHAEIREIRDRSFREKYQMYADIRMNNQKRSQSVKLEHKRQAEKLKKIGKVRDEENKQDYLKRVQKEEEVRKELEARVIDMEILEMDLIKKLQNTQYIQAKTMTELAETIKRKPQSAMK